MGATLPALPVLVVAAAGYAVRRLLIGGAAARAGLLARMVSGPPVIVDSTGWAPPRFVAALHDGGIDGDPVRWWRRWAMTTALVAASAVMAGGAIAAASATVLTIACPVVYLYGARHRHDERAEHALPQMLETAAAALRSGASLPGALAAAAEVPGPLRPDLETLVAAVDRGAPLGAELDRWAVRRPLPGIRLTAAALVMGVEAGGARARAVDGIADTLRDRAAIRREVAAQSAQARSSMVVMSAVPVVVALLAASTDDRTAAFLFSTAAGALCVLLGLALDGVAVLWMAHLIRRASHIPTTAR